MTPNCLRARRRPILGAAFPPRQLATLRLDYAAPAQLLAGWIELEERCRNPAFLKTRRRISLDEVKIQDRVGLVELDVNLGPAWDGAGDVQTVVAVVQVHARLGHLALIDPVGPSRVARPGDRNAARIGVWIVGEGQVRYVRVTRDTRGARDRYAGLGGSRRGRAAHVARTPTADKQDHA